MLPTAAVDVVQANGLQLEMCICTWHISSAYSFDQYDPQTDRADLALLSEAQGKMERQGTSVPSVPLCTTMPSKHMYDAPSALLQLHVQCSALLHLSMAQ